MTVQDPHRRIEGVIRRRTGAQVIVGLDEVGRGSWAGPLAVGAAIIPTEGKLVGLRDSKMLSQTKREEMYDSVLDWCTAWSVGFASAQECDVFGMSQAQKLAAQRALANMYERYRARPDHAVIDGPYDFIGVGYGALNIGVTTVVKGDRESMSIAAASVIAKVTRDRLMRTLSEEFPYYDFAYNKGYPCQRHKAGLMAWGPSSIHRKTWSFMEKLPWLVGTSFDLRVQTDLVDKRELFRATRATTIN